MKMTVTRIILLIFVLVGLVSTQPVSAKPQMIDLGTLGGRASLANAINKKGQIVGSSTTADGKEYAVLWENGTIKNLGALGGNPDSNFVSLAADINDAGKIVGTSWTTFGESAFLLEGSTVIYPGTLGGNTSSAFGISKKGEVVGSSANNDGYTHAYYWKKGIKMVDLGTLGGTFSQALDINNIGQVVGGSEIEEGGNFHPFLWDRRTGMTEMVTLGEGGQPFAINDNTQIVGYYITATGGFRAFLWENGTMVDLGTLGGDQSFANDINNSGQIVGGCQTITGEFHACLWENGTLTDLGTLGGAFINSVATSINEVGQIVGYSYSPTAEYHAFLWTR